MASYQISSRQELIDYCKRALGWPIVNINVTDDQVNDRINDALDMFFEYHFDGSYRALLTVILSQTDINNQYITLPPGVVSVTHVVLQTSDMEATPIFQGNLQTYGYFSDLISNMRSDGLSSYVQTLSYLNLIDEVISGPGKISAFNKHADQLTIQMDWSTFKVGDAIGAEVYIHPDIDTVGKTFNNYWLKLYCTALIKKQWATNLIKFGGLQLPGGGQLRADVILQEANQEIEELQRRLFDEFSQRPIVIMA